MVQTQAGAQQMQMLYVETDRLPGSGLRILLELSLKSAKEVAYE
jgi:hypothetical protein